MRFIASLALSLAPLLVGCGSRGPLDELGPVVRQLGEPGAPTLARTKLLYESLDGATRAAVDARAAAMSSAAGRKVEPTEAIQFRGFDGGVRVADVELVEEAEGRATIRAMLSRVSGPEGGLMPDPITLAVVLEDGHWKLSVPGLLAAVTAQTDNAPRPDATGRTQPAGDR